MNERFYLLKIQLLDIEPSIWRRFVVPGYFKFCNALKDPNHEKHESYIEWSGGDFDSESFDANSVNWKLMKYLRWSRDRYQNWGGIE